MVTTKVLLRKHHHDIMYNKFIIDADKTYVCEFMAVIYEFKVDDYDCVEFVDRFIATKTERGCALSEETWCGNFNTPYVQFDDYIKKNKELLYVSELCDLDLVKMTSDEINKMLRLVNTRLVDSVVIALRLPVEYYKNKTLNECVISAINANKCKMVVTLTDTIVGTHIKLK